MVRTSKLTSRRSSSLSRRQKSSCRSHSPQWLRHFCPLGSHLTNVVATPLWGVWQRVEPPSLRLRRAKGQRVSPEDLNFFLFVNRGDFLFWLNRGLRGSNGFNSPQEHKCAEREDRINKMKQNVLKLARRYPSRLYLLSRKSLSSILFILSKPPWPLRPPRSHDWRSPRRTPCNLLFRNAPGSPIPATAGPCNDLTL